MSSANRGAAVSSRSGFRSAQPTCPANGSRPRPPRRLHPFDLDAFVEEAARWAVPGEKTDVADRSDGEPMTAAPSTERVLLAEDNADMRAYLRRLLSRRWDVEFAVDGLAALEAAQKRTPDLVLSDVMMPGLDGFELLRALRADPRTRAVPVILLSARAGEDRTVEGLDAGADDYLSCFRSPPSGS